MNWLAPLNVKLPSRGKFMRKDGRPLPNTSRPIVLHGVSYNSITEARQALGCSCSKIYYMLGEHERAGRASRTNTLSEGDSGKRGFPVVMPKPQSGEASKNDCTSLDIAKMAEDGVTR